VRFGFEASLSTILNPSARIPTVMGVSHLASLALAVLIVSACRSAPEALPAGGGLVSVDRLAPPGVELVEAPEWQVGDRFVFRKGGLARLAYRVSATVDGVHHLTDEQSGMVTLVDGQLAELGQDKPDEPALTRRFDPADNLLTWPLWVGKRWTSHYVSRAPGRRDVPLQTTYHCDAIEMVKVPAGTLRAWRVWRRTRVAAEGEYLERVSVLWYAPEVGVIVRRLTGGLLLELEECHRQ